VTEQLHFVNLASFTLQDVQGLLLGGHEQDEEKSHSPREKKPFSA